MRPLAEAWFVQHASRIIVKLPAEVVMRRKSLSLLAVLALLGGCMPMEQRTAHFENKWPANGVTDLNVSEVNGTVTVQGDSPGAITMVANVRARGVRPDPKKPYDGYM